MLNLDKILNEVSTPSSNGWLEKITREATSNPNDNASVSINYEDLSGWASVTVQQGFHVVDLSYVKEFSREGMVVMIDCRQVIRKDEAASYHRELALAIHYWENGNEHYLPEEQIRPKDENVTPFWEAAKKLKKLVQEIDKDPIAYISSRLPKAA